MTQRLARYFLILLLLPLAACAKSYDESRYITLKQPVATETGDKVEVLEFFWYGCPHCYHLDPLLSRWAEKLPANVKFVRVPAPLNPRWMPHAQAYYALQTMGKGETFHKVLFDAIHKDRRRLFTLDAIADFLQEKGIDRQLFIETANSFAVQARARHAAQLGEEYKIHGVPALAVNGKYVVTTEKAGSFEEMLNITDFLIGKESKK